MTRPPAARRATRCGGLAMSEDQFKGRVIDAAKLHGWMVHHSRPVRVRPGKVITPIQGHAGLPDLVLARDGVVLLAELKTDKGYATPEQKRWLAHAGPSARLWRPKDWDTVLAELSTPRQPGYSDR